MTCSYRFKFDTWLRWEKYHYFIFIVIFIFFCNKIIQEILRLRHCFEASISYMTVYEFYAWPSRYPKPLVPVLDVRLLLCQTLYPSILESFCGVNFIFHNQIFFFFFAFDSRQCRQRQETGVIEKQKYNMQQRSTSWESNCGVSVM